METIQRRIGTRGSLCDTSPVAGSTGDLRAAIFTVFTATTNGDTAALKRHRAMLQSVGRAGVRFTPLTFVPDARERPHHRAISPGQEGGRQIAGVLERHAGE